MKLPENIANSIARFARESYPYESCGALFGAADAVAQIMPLTNSSDEPKERRYRIRPQDYQRVEMRAAQEHLDLLGFYHSHPNHPPRPSAYDLEHAWPNLIYVIVSVDSFAAGRPRAWLLSEDGSRFDEVEIEGEPDAHDNLHSHTAAAVREPARER